MASRYPRSPWPQMVFTQAGAVTDTARNGSRAVMSEMCTSTAGKSTARSAS